MDLLGGYGSSSDESDSPATATATAIPIATAAPKPKTETASTSTAFTATAAATATTRRGKKILSLAAVLPQHILDQLTQSQVKGRGSNNNNDDSSSSSSDDDDSNRGHDYDTKQHASITSKSLHQKKAAAGSSSTSAPVIKDQGLFNLLSALNAAPTQGLVAKPKEQVASHVKMERMGAAFLSSSITTNNGSGEEVVRDIHNNNNNNNIGNAAVQAAPLTMQTVAAVAPRRAVSVAVPRPNPTTAFTKQPAAAPPVGAHQDASSLYSMPGAPDAATASASLHPQQQQQSRKRSRKDMERALRQGNMAAVDNHAGLRIELVEQAQPDQYQPTEESYAVPAHGVKVTATAMYDPSQGQAVVGSSSVDATKGKNQINQLMANAANLEMQRARGIGSGAGAQAQGKTHRANAKHKYGW